SVRVLGCRGLIHRFPARPAANALDELHGHGRILVEELARTDGCWHLEVGATPGDDDHCFPLRASFQSNFQESVRRLVSVPILEARCALFPARARYAGAASRCKRAQDQVSGWARLIIYAKRVARCV